MINYKTYVIFDFDGTLINSFNVLMEKFLILADEFNFRKINNYEIENLRELTSRELISYLEIPIYKIPFVVRSVRKYMQKEMETLLPFANLATLLHDLHDLGITLGILTSNSLKNVEKWLRRNKLQHMFSFVHSESNYFGKSRILHKIIKTYKIDKSQAFYIGDETRDIEAAKECEMYSIAVTWGFNSEKILLQHRPHFVARKPSDIISAYKSVINL